MDLNQEDGCHHNLAFNCMLASSKLQNCISDACPDVEGVKVIPDFTEVCS